MIRPLSIEEQERLLKGNQLLVRAVDSFIKAKKDLKDYPYSPSIKAAYQRAYKNLSNIAKQENQIN